jgi:hypothetical protein
LGGTVLTKGVVKIAYLNAHHDVDATVSERRRDGEGALARHYGRLDLARDQEVVPQVRRDLSQPTLVSQGLSQALGCPQVFDDAWQLGQLDQ